MTKIGRLMINDVFSIGIRPLITIPTRITYHFATLIDYIYTNQYPTDITAGVVVCSISDHLPMLIVLPSEAKKFSFNQSIKRYEAFFS